MKSTQPGEQSMTEKSNDELLVMLAQPNDWRPDMLEAAKAQLERRGFEFTAATPQAAPSDPEFDELQRVASRRILLKNLRGRGIGSIIWGLIASGLGIAGMEVDRANAILAAIGVFLTIEGIRVVAAPAPAGLIVDGFALLILGIWNLAITVMSASSGVPPIFAIIGVLQIAWGCQSFFKYAQFSKTSSAVPSATALQSFDQLVNYIQGANVADDASLVAFITSGQIEWKGQFRATGAVFVAQRSGKRSRGRKPADGDIIFAAKADVSFRKDADGLAPNTLKMTFSIKARKFSGVMPQEAFDRYETWMVGIKSTGPRVPRMNPEHRPQRCPPAPA
jgi:hypothetical protein